MGIDSLPLSFSVRVELGGALEMEAGVEAKVRAALKPHVTPSYPLTFPLSHPPPLNLHPQPPPFLVPHPLPNPPPPPPLYTSNPSPPPEHAVHALCDGARGRRGVVPHKAGAADILPAGLGLHPARQQRCVRVPHLSGTGLAVGRGLG
eukprot:363610-Chlamydomonas_euryale.AAC.9